MAGRLALRPRAQAGEQPFDVLRQPRELTAFRRPPAARLEHELPLAADEVGDSGVITRLPRIGCGRTVLELAVDGGEDRDCGRDERERQRKLARHP